MKIAVFLHGTLIMHTSAAQVSRKARVEQVKQHDPSVYDYAAYIPVGNAVEKLAAWHNQGAEIIYLSSHKDAADVAKDKVVLEGYRFPVGPVHYRQNGESYAVVIERLLPDILIEDDCESIGGVNEMAITHVRPKLRQTIISIPVKEFGGIDYLPDDPILLQKTLANRDKI